MHRRANTFLKDLFNDGENKGHITQELKENAAAQTAATIAQAVEAAHQDTIDRADAEASLQQAASTAIQEPPLGAEGAAVVNLI